MSAAGGRRGQAKGGPRAKATRTWLQGSAEEAWWVGGHQLKSSWRTADASALPRLPAAENLSGARSHEANAEKVSVGHLGAKCYSACCIEQRCSSACCIERSVCMYVCMYVLNDTYVCMYVCMIQKICQVSIFSFGMQLACDIVTAYHCSHFGLQFCQCF